MERPFFYCMEQYETQTKKEVIEEAKRQNKSVHFGSLMELCHLKHAELEEHLQSYKGRVVFRGDMVKDETGSFAVFTEQSASASMIAAAKMLDALARMPGMTGGHRDGRKAYTQVLLKDAAELLGLPPEQVPDTYITLPRDRRPEWWDKIEDPVVLLERNLYGHPLGGLLWERFLQRCLTRNGWRKAYSLEMLSIRLR